MGHDFNLDFFTHELFCFLFPKIVTKNNIHQSKYINTSLGYMNSLQEKSFEEKEKTQAKPDEM